MSSGVCGYGSRFSLAASLAEQAGRVRLVVYTANPVAPPRVTYGGVPMACIDAGKHRAPASEHNYEVINPSIGHQVITGTFSEDVYFEVRSLVAEAFPDLPG